MKHSNAGWCVHLPLVFGQAEQGQRREREVVQRPLPSAHFSRAPAAGSCAPSSSSPRVLAAQSGLCSPFALPLFFSTVTDLLLLFVFLPSPRGRRV
uniref:Transmembrane protein n=1 Tax=Athene cunicularia TaxID=194338 RepID=A0A663LL99_ATHCN